MLPSEEGEARRRAGEPIVDPRLGDAEDDGSSTKRRSLLSLAGTLLAEISLAKFILAWTMLLGIPSLVLGASPLIASIWIGGVSSKVPALLTGIWPALLLALLALFGWYAGGPLWRWAENSFWSLNALAVQPGYALVRESLQHLVEWLLPAGIGQARRGSVRAAVSAAAGVAVLVAGCLIAALVWPATHWIGIPADLASPARLALSSAANAIAILAGYFAAAGLVWGIADATMPQPRDLRAFDAPPRDGQTWRIAHLSDLHVVAERYGFRIESGRAGPQGNERLRRVFDRLAEVHAENPLDAILITGDLTDAGRSAEWAEFFDELKRHPDLVELVLAIPGNHDINVVDRSNPARLDLPLSPAKRLREMRMLVALEALQGRKVQVLDRDSGKSRSLTETLKPYLDDIRLFSDQGTRRVSRRLANLWDSAFPMLLPPASEEGLGIILLNSNAETHFSFTNALGIMPAEQVHDIDRIRALYPKARFIVALHHHLVEYPQPAKALSERVGTALINGSWFVRRLQRFSDHAVLMHGHRHIDWIGECGGLVIVSAPSPVMGGAESEAYFYIHTLATGEDRRLRLLEPQKIEIGPHPVAEAPASFRSPGSEAVGAALGRWPASRKLFD